MAVPGRTDDPRAADAPDATGSSVPAEPSAGSRTRGKDARSQTTQEAQPAAPPALESAPAPEPDALVVALFLPDSETWCTGDGTPYRAHHGRPVHVRRHHVPELVARGAREPEQEAEPQPV